MKMIRKNNLSTLLIWGSFLFFSFLFVGCNPVAEKQKELPYIGHHDILGEDTIYHKIANWSFTTQHHEELLSTSIDDKIWIADFIFTTCPTICSPMTYQMKKVNDSLQELKDEIVFLSFSIDPQKDTPQQLSNYIEKHGITADNWYFLTDSLVQDINQFAIQEFQIFATDDEDAPGGFAHSQNFVLVDKNNHIRGIYDGLDDDQRQQLIDDVRFLKGK